MRKLALVLFVALCLSAFAVGITPEEKRQFDLEHSGHGSSHQVSPGLTGAHALIFSEEFEGAVPPAGWTMVNNAGGAVVWNTNTSFTHGNWTGGAGNCAEACSDCVGTAEFDVELRTPVINCTGVTNATLTFNANYQNFANYDFFAVDVSNDGGTTWNNVLSWNEDHGGFQALPGAPVNLNISAYADNQPNVMIRFHYWDPNTGDYDWYVQVDSVAVNGDQAPIPTLSPVGLLGLVAVLAGAGFLVWRRL